MLLLACKGEVVDSGDPVVDTDCEQSPYFLDEDGDGLGVGTPEHRCEPGEGFTASTDGDCYDESSSVGATGLWLLGTEDVDLTLLAEQLLDLDVTEPSTLVVCEGTWPLSVTATAELVVVGEGEDSVLTGLNEARVFDTSAPLTLLSVQLTEGFADGDGGAIWTDSDVVMFHSSVRDSEAIGSGGALFQAGAEATVTFTSSDFEDNFASDNGGAAVIEGHLESGGTSFRNNSATNGGALYLGIGTSLFDGAIFEGNTADRGGAMDLRPPHVTTLGNSTLTGNQASFGGAFATWETARLDCVDSVIEGNTGDTKGGAAWLLPSNDAVSLSSENCSWGEGDTDNVRDDIYNTQTAYAGTGGTWTCTGVSCEL